MMHPLQRQITAIGRTAKALMVIYSLGRVMCLLSIGLILLALLDYGLYAFLRIDDHSMRLLFSVLLIFLLVVAVYRNMLPAVKRTWNDVEVAQLVERWSPRLRDQLSSSIAFLHQPGDASGSAALRRSVIDQTSALVAQLPLRRVLKPGPTLWISSLVILLCGSIAGAVLASPHARLAARRLVFPLSHAPWPKRNQLRFLMAPRRLASGDDFEVALIDARDQLPDAIEFQFREAGDQRVQKSPMTLRGDRMVVRLENVTKSLEYRAEGGDDDSMPWQRLDVTEPARLDDIEVQLIPPTYSGQQSSKSGMNIRALRGTTVRISGTASKPLQKIELRIQSGSESIELVGSLEANQRTFTVPAKKAGGWTVEESGVYWLEMTDKQGIVSGRKQRWQIHAVMDQPPSVSLATPQQNAFVTNQAIVPVAVTVEDDLAIRSTELRYTRSDLIEHGDVSIDLFRGPTVAQYEPDRPQKSARQAVSFEWNLARLADLHPGQYIDLVVAASDYLPQYDLSSPRRLSVVTIAQFEDRIGQRQSQILGKLAEALEAERNSLRQTTAIAIQLDESPSIDRQRLDQLQSAELSQREVNRLLQDPREGIQSQIEAVLEDLDNNRIDNAELRQPLNLVGDQVRVIQNEILTKVQQELLAALKSARTVVHRDSAEQPANDLAEIEKIRNQILVAGQGQTRIVGLLERLLGDLSEWDNFRRLSRDVRLIGRQQSKITAQTDEASRELIGKSLDELNVKQRSRLRVLAQNQLELSRQFDSTRRRMRQMQERMKTQDPTVAQTIADALQAAQRSSIEGRMHESGRNIQQNQLGQAAQAQRKVAVTLQEIDDILTSRPEHQLQRVVDGLQEVENELADAIRQVNKMRRDLDSSSQPHSATADLRNREEHEQVATQLGRLGRQLERLRADSAATSVQQGEQSVRRAIQSADQARSTAAVTNAETAQQKLQDARQALQLEIRTAQQKLKQQRLIRFYRQVEQLTTRQLEISNKTQSLNRSQSQQTEPTATERALVRDLSLQQQSIGEETTRLGESNAEWHAFAFALDGAGRQMYQAANQLAAGVTDRTVQQPQDSALHRLRQVLDALKQDDSPIDPAGRETSSGEKPEHRPSESESLLAELKLLRSLQEHLNQRTEQWADETSPAQKVIGRDEQRRLDALAAEQGRLAAIVSALVQPEVSDSVDNPKSAADPERTEGLDSLDRLFDAPPQPD